MRKTASINTIHSEVVMVKPEISAAAFGELRADFVKERLAQFAERRNLTINEATDIMHSPGGYRQIDQVVDEHLHLSMCPDPTNFRIV